MMQLLTRSVLLRREVLAGAMFMAVALFGLFLSRDYPVGSTLRMGTGYVPRLLCWLLLGLGAVILWRGMRDVYAPRLSSAGALATLRPILVVTAALIAFGLTLERLGLVVAIVLLVVIASFAGRGLRAWETALAAIVLCLICWVIFIVGLGLTIALWPEW